MSTDDEFERIRKYLNKVYTDAAKDVKEKASKFFAKFTAQDKKMRKKLEDGEISEGYYNSWREREMMRGRYWNTMRKQMARRLVNADKTAMDYVNGRLPQIYADNYNYFSNDVTNMHLGVVFELVDENTVRRLVKEQKTILPYKDVDGKKCERWHTQRVNAQVLQGIVQGESNDEIAERLKKYAGMIAKGSAMRNARTATTGAENAGRVDMLKDAEKAGVIMKKVWSCLHDKRTRDAHLDLDGKEREPDDPFDSKLGDIYYPGDPSAVPANVYNCRCTLTYKIVGFGERKNADTIRRG